MSDNLLIQHEHLQALLDAVLAADTTGNAATTTHVIAAKEALSAPLVWRKAPEADEVRGYFEDACKKSTSHKFPLNYVKVNGAFHHYFDSDTDSAFLGYRGGFNRGVNWERRQRRGQPEPAPAAQPTVGSNQP